MPETKTPFRIRPLTIVLTAIAVALVTIGVVYFTMSHPKHGLLALGLAAGCLIAAWFTTGDTRLKA